jgi:hypothetical protein
MANAAINNLVLINSPDEAAAVVNTPTGNFSLMNTAAGAGSPAAEMQVRVNTSQQVRAVASAASTSLYLSTYGYFDDRGRNA